MNKKENQMLVNRPYLEKYLKEVIEGNATFYSIGEVEQRLDQVTPTFFSLKLR